MKVVVGMSGGVDSSVAAALLVQRGYDVTGIMLRLWSEPGKEDSNRCCTPDAMFMARRVAAQLGVPFYVLDAKDMFKKQVVDGFISGYAQGITPNPCLICNQTIKWGFLFDYAKSMGADFMATGHYARLKRQNNHLVSLLRAKDENKDQSYALSALSQGQLAHSLLPLGEMTKPEVRQLARDMGLVVAERVESQDLCFLSGDDYREFLIRHVPEVIRPGAIHDRQGHVVGRHQGLAFYTIGQRKGLGIAAAEPLYVIEKDMTNNTLVVSNRQELGKCSLVARDANWIDGSYPETTFRATVKIRYKAEDIAAMIIPLPEYRFRVNFNQNMYDITPGQFAVVYDGEICLGSGVIESAQ